MQHQKNAEQSQPFKIKIKATATIRRKGEETMSQIVRYQSTKTYNHEVGLTSCFRQWKADSHCKYLHGYALKVKLVFETSELDVRNWVVDFGSLKSVKGFLEDWFDHKTLVAEDDPELESFQQLHNQGLIDLRIVPATGCEKFAEFIWEYVDGWLASAGYKPRCKVISCEVAEHGGNSAIYVVEA